ncbi:MAG: hypothetical protein WC530_07930 [Candidatus Omnitrophota bacterium]|jgi:hypothetical protein
MADDKKVPKAPVMKLNCPHCGGGLKLDSKSGQLKCSGFMCDYSVAFPAHLREENLAKLQEWLNRQTTGGE